MAERETDIAVVGAGAAGLMAAVWAGRELKAAGAEPATPAGPRVLALDGAKVLGAKILVAGGGRCNVTHHAVDESAYFGSSRHAIKKVLRAFGVGPTVEFFRALGVELKREETGKLFPTTDDARTVLSALLGAVREAGAEVLHPWRVSSVVARPSGASGGAAFEVIGPDGAVVGARRVILATGGRALPRSGSDGAGYDIARSLGHTVTPLVTPALVPLLLADGCFLRELPGLTFPATITLWTGTGRREIEFTNSTLLTHFGVSGPGVLDLSRSWLSLRQTDPGCRLTLSVVPGLTPEGTDAALAELVSRRAPSVLRCVQGVAPGVPERLARALCAQAGLDPSGATDHLSRASRRALAGALAALPLPAVGDRGYTYAEATAGGIPLEELRLETMESRLCPGLHVCGELCDVDGRIGGFNFQWAWASGHLAGRGAARAIAGAAPVSR